MKEARARLAAAQSAGDELGRITDPDSRPSRRADDRDAIISALLEYGTDPGPMDDTLQAHSFTPDPEANRLLTDDPFAFLLGVLFDAVIPAERAWTAPYLLRERLGHLDPQAMIDDPDAVHAAVNISPKLHRFTNHMSQAVVAAARLVVEQYDGRAERIWNDSPTARQLQDRLLQFRQIGQKKAAMAVEILERDLGVTVLDLSGSDIAYDVHLRRVFLRTGLASFDDREHMIDVARRAHPDRPGALDLPSWQIGRKYCGPAEPLCRQCPLESVCPKDIGATVGITGLA